MNQTSELRTAGNSRLRLKNMTTMLVSIAGLLATIILFAILTNGKILSPVNLQSMTNQFTVTVLVAIGATCTYGVGNFDVSLGACVCASAITAGMVAIATGSLLLSFVACLVVSLLIGALKGIMAAYVSVPYFIFSVVLGSIISALVLVVLGDNTTLMLSNAVTPIPSLSYLQMSLVNVAVIVVYLFVGVILFRYTGFGLRIKMLGGNKTAARQAGIDIVKTRILAFIFAAVGIALGAFLLMLRSRVVAYNTATSTGHDVMVAITLGGMALSGGPKTKISAGVIGAITITVINSGLGILGLDVGIRQIIRGVIFLIVVAIATTGIEEKGISR